jgi:2,4-diaminopentanoate dehydrogenase
LELVGVYVHSADKSGMDAGELCGLGRVGVAATNDIEKIVALKPDCVVYMPHLTNYDEICRLLESGANIVTTRGDFHRPASMDPKLRARVEDACKRGNSSIHSTGSSPGFVTEALPLVLSSIQRRLDHLSINEFADTSSRNSPAMIFEVMGFGGPPPPPEALQGRLHYLRNAFGPSLELVADALSLPLDGLEVSGGSGLARKDTRIAAGLIPAGTVAAQRTTVSGMRGGKAILSFTATWYVATDLDVDWNLRESGWHIRVDGDAPLDVSIRFPVAPENYADMTPGLTAHRPVNVIPYICEAEPGIKTTVDLPQIIPVLG